jgi:hypothetical protein
VKDTGVTGTFTEANASFLLPNPLQGIYLVFFIVVVEVLQQFSDESSMFKTCR